MDTSNIGQVEAWLGGFVASFNFARPGTDQSLGRDLARKESQLIGERALVEKRGAGEPWDLNEPKYAEWKSERYKIGTEEPNSRTGQMLSEKSIFGRTRVEPELVTMVYGVDAPPDRTFTGADLSEADKKVTDCQKADYAHTARGPHKVKRPFYEPDKGDGAELSTLAQENLNDLINATNAANGY